MFDKICLDGDGVRTNIRSDVRVLVQLSRSLDAQKRRITSYDLEADHTVVSTKLALFEQGVREQRSQLLVNIAVYWCAHVDWRRDLLNDRCYTARDL